MSGSSIKVQGVKSVVVPVEFIHSKTLRPATKMLYLHLLSRAPEATPNAHFSLTLANLSTQVGQSRSRVEYMIGELKREKLLKVSQTANATGKKVTLKKVTLFTVRPWIDDADDADEVDDANDADERTNGRTDEVSNEGTPQCAAV